MAPGLLLPRAAGSQAWGGLGGDGGAAVAVQAVQAVGGHAPYLGVTVVISVVGRRMWQVVMVKVDGVWGRLLTERNTGRDRRRGVNGEGVHDTGGEGGSGTPRDSQSWAARCHRQQKAACRGRSCSSIGIWRLLRGRGCEQEWERELPSLPAPSLPHARAAAGAHQCEDEGSPRQGGCRTALAQLQTEHPHRDGRMAGTGHQHKRGERRGVQGAAWAGGWGHPGGHDVPSAPLPRAHPQGAPWLWWALR